jgi:hypothetical protein
MSEKVFYILYYSALIFSISIGIKRYNLFDGGSQIIFWLLAITLANEILIFVFEIKALNKTLIYHFYNPVELFVVTLYFLITIKVNYFRIFAVLCGTLYAILEIANTVFLQPLTRLNSNYIIFESFVIIAMSLFALYRILVNDNLYPVLKYAHFWFWSFILLYFSVTFFYWPCIKVLYRDHSIYYTIANDIEMVVNILVYAGIGAVIFFYPKIIKHES